MCQESGLYAKVWWQGVLVKFELGRYELVCMSECGG